MHSQFPKVIVGALIFDTDQRLFLMQSAGKFGSQWIVPGGKVDFGESMADGLVREIKEETNLDVTHVEFLGVRELIEPERHFVFLEFQCVAMNPAQVRLNHEATQFRWLQKSEIGDLSLAPSTLELIQERWP